MIDQSQLPQQPPDWGSLCLAHNEAINEQRVQVALLCATMSDLKNIVTNGLQADMQEMKTDVKNILASLEEMKLETNMVHKVRQVGKYTYQGGRLLATGVGAGMAIVSIILAFCKYILGII